MKSRKFNPQWFSSALLLGSALLVAMPTWGQQPAATSDATNVPAAKAPASPDANAPVISDDRMVTPPPVSGQSYPTASLSQERSNYLRGGLAFLSAYTDNAVGPVNGHPESDLSYSLAPFVALDEMTSRTHLLLTYAPGFTFYQRFNAKNEADQNAAIDFTYRLSPHVTFAAHDGFQKSSNVLNQPDPASAGTVSGGTQGVNFSVIAPLADRLSNAGNAGITYQFARNAMIGANGTFTNLHYPNQAEVPGLLDAASQGGSAFYSLRISKTNYLGAEYQYQHLQSFPTPGTNQTDTHAALLFYTVYPTAKFSISLFGGPQYADAGAQFAITGATPSSPASHSWNPQAGGSLSWQGLRGNVAVGYAHMIASGGGLIGAVRLDSASATLGQQLSKTLTASLVGGYAQNDLLAASVANNNGHTVSVTAVLRQRFGQNLDVQMGYTRIHQAYSAVPVLATTPDTNREFVSLTYQFSRALGR